MNLLGKELKRIILGEKIGAGAARSAYVCRLNPEYVVKIETAGGSFQNVAEWEAWTWFNGGHYAKWLAPCEMISPCGLVLLQRRCTPMRANERPKRIPAILTDIKQENFGVLDGRVVCFDYGTIASRAREYPRSMVAAKW